MTIADELEALARAMALDAGLNPDELRDTPNGPREPVWKMFRENARVELALGGREGVG